MLTPNPSNFKRRAVSRIPAAGTGDAGIARKDGCPLPVWQHRERPVTAHPVVDYAARAGTSAPAARFPIDVRR